MPGLRDGIALRSDIVMADNPGQMISAYSAVVARGSTVLMLSASSDALTDATFGLLLTKAVGRLDAVS